MGSAVQSLTDISAARMVFASLGSAPVEIAAFAFLDRRHGVIAVRQAAAGHVSAVEVSLRLVAREAIALDAAGIVMAHNHPSADARPSESDIAVTRSAAQVFGTLDVKLVDHLIVTATTMTSLRALGLL